MPDTGESWTYHAQLVAYVEPPAHASGAAEGAGAVFTGGAVGAGVDGGGVGDGVSVGMAASGVAVAAGTEAGTTVVDAWAFTWWAGVEWCVGGAALGGAELSGVPCSAPASAASICEGMYMKAKVPRMTPAATAKRRLMILLFPFLSNRAAWE